MKKGIVFFDLDGTLLNNKLDEIPDSALRAIDELRPNYYIVISSGRDMDTHYSVRYRDIVRPDAIIHQNGNKVTVGGLLLFRHVMDKALVRELFDFCKANDFCVGTSIGSEDFYTLPEVKTAAELVYKKESVRNYVPFEQLFERNLEVQAMAVAGDMSVLKPVIEARFPMLKLYPFASATSADVVEVGYSKAEGMKRLCDYYGISIKNTYAFGDSSNDVDQIKAAGCGIAMGNAVAELKAVADYITDDITNDGVYNACRHFGLI